MQNFISEGGTLDWTNGTGNPVLSGQAVVAGHTIGVAVTDIAPGAMGALKIGGVYTLPKVSGAVFVKGEKLIWDASAGAFDDSAATPASGDITGGAIAWAAGADGETTATVKLTPGNTTKA